MDETGASGGASITWKADGTWILPVADSPGNARMMAGYLDNGSGNTTTVTVANLPPSPTGYDVYVYTAGDNGSVTRTATFTISGPGVTTASTGITYPAGVVFSGAFTQANNSAGNYVKFSINATGFTLNAIPGTSPDGYKRAPVNGIEIVPSAGNVPPDYGLSVNGTQTVTPGAAASYTVGVAPSNGFNSTVALSVTGLPAGTTANFNPASISGSGNSTLQVLTSNATPSGTYQLTVSGVSGSLTHTATTQLVVSSVGARVAAVSIDFVGNGTPMAASESAGVVSKTHWNEATGASSSAPLALVDETGASGGASITWKADGTWILPVADSPGNARMMAGYLDNGSGNTTTVTVANLPPSPTGYDVYVYTAGDNGAVTRTATFTISGPGVTTASTGITYPAGVVFSGAFTQANNSAGNYVKFSINATGFTLNAIPGASPDGYKRAPVNGIEIVPSAGNVPPDYGISVNSTQTVTAGAAGSYIVGVIPSNGFNSTVALSVTGLPAGTTASFNPASISGSGNATLQVLTSNATPSGTYQLTISGVSGSLTHSATTQLVVSSVGARAAAVSIDFVGNGTPMAPSESAGVVSKTHWNEATGASSSAPLALVDETGASSGASVTWKADSTYILPVADNPGNARLMAGYLDNGSGNTTSVTVANLPPSSTGYDVYVYTDGDNGAITRTATYTISGPGMTTASIGVTDAAGTVFSGALLRPTTPPATTSNSLSTPPALRSTQSRALPRTATNARL